MSFLDRYFEIGSQVFLAPPKRSRILSLDFETYSEVDLRVAGASVYARHPSTRAMMLAYGFKGEPIRQWFPEAQPEMPADLREALDDPSVTLSAWNAAFERAIFQHVLGEDIPVRRWMDVMVWAFCLSLPGKLSMCGKVLGLPADQQKESRGSALIRKFCKPRKPTAAKPWKRATAETDPEDWADFCDYNRQDVVAEQAIYARLRRYKMPDFEWDLWHLDQKINDAGIPISLETARAAQGHTTRVIRAAVDEMKTITGLANPASPQQLLPWLRQNGYPFNDLRKGHVERAMKGGQGEQQAEDPVDYSMLDPDAVRVLELRLRASKSSVKKFKALLQATDEDGNLRGAHQFAGAPRTARWSGRRFQPQNLSKPEKRLEKRIPEIAADILLLTTDQLEAKYGNAMDALVAAVRPTVQAPKGALLVDADLSAIENVVLGWLARDDRILRVFREGLDPYIDFATDMFGMSYAQIEAINNAGDKTMRTTAKPGVLGCGYMLGAGAAVENPDTGEIEATGLLGYAWAMNVKLTPEMSKLSVETFRAKFVDVVQFWYDLDRAARRTIRSGEPQTVGYLHFDLHGPFMRIRLPSGRHLHYLRPKLQERWMPWGEQKLSITYENLEKGQWRRVTTHPGKLAENVTQAVARDLLAHGMTLADRRGHDLRLHVHDQAVSLAPSGAADAMLRTLIQSLTTRPTWADDKLPLKAAGFTSRVFLKD